MQVLGFLGASNVLAAAYLLFAVLLGILSPLLGKGILLLHE
jgi:hypothetical protein